MTGGAGFIGSHVMADLRGGRPSRCAAYDSLTRPCTTDAPPATVDDMLLVRGRRPGPRRGSRRARRRRRGVPPGRAGRARRRPGRPAGVLGCQRPAPRCCSTRWAGPAFGGWCSPPRWWCTARARTTAQHGRVRPASRAGEDCRGPVRAALPALRPALTGPRWRGRAAGPAQRLRDEQAGPGAPGRQLGPADRRHRPSRCAITTCTAPGCRGTRRTPGWPPSSAPPGERRRRGCSRTAAQRRDFVHVPDVARANVLAIARPARWRGRAPAAFNVASGPPRTRWARWPRRWPCVRRRPGAARDGRVPARRRPARRWLRRPPPSRTSGSGPRSRSPVASASSPGPNCGRRPASRPPWAKPRLPALILPEQGQEELVDDRPDAGGLRGLEVHEQVVAHQVERQVEHRGRDALEVDLAAVVGPLVDGRGVRERPVAHDLVADLGRAEAGVGQQPREGGRRGDGEEAGAGLRSRPSAGRAGRCAGRRCRGRRPGGRCGGARSRRAPAGPCWPSGGRARRSLVRARIGDRFHRQAGVADLDQLVPGRAVSSADSSSLPCRRRRTGSAASVATASR